MEHHVNLVHNIPFFSVFFAMFCGIITPLLKSGRAARHLHGFMVGLVGILSVVLLANVVKNQEAYTFMMGHFPAPWGNELRIGPLEALLAVMVSVVMFLTITAGSRQIFEEIVPEKQKFYFIMLNATYGAMLAMTYTNDMFTGYVFIEILTIASCTLILARGTKQAIVGTTHYLVFGCMGSGLFLLGVCILYGITGQLLFPQMKETIAMLMETGQYHFPLMIVVSLMFMGLGIKSGLFPFHSALPTAYGSTMTTSNGILSGLVLKAYIILAIKLVFEAVKQSVTTRQAAEHYGVRVGRNGMCVCPFHDDKNPSMKVDRRFHCFGCQADGDVIDFVSRLENVSPKEAALMLAQDFSVPYEDREPPGRSRRPKPRQESPEQQFKRMERHCFRVLSDYHNLLRRWKRDYAPKTPEEEWHPLFVEALQKQSHVEYLLDVLLFSDIGERAALIASYGKEVRNLERRMADLAARTAAGRDGHHRSRTPAPER